MADKYTNELAATVVRMFNDGLQDPSADEIAEEHFPDKALGGEIADGIRKRFLKIRDIVEEQYEIPCALVTETYYTVYRHRPLETMTVRDAYRCIPGGYHNPRYGIRKQQGDDDLIWRATVERNLISAAGKEKKSVDRVLAAVASEDISSENARELIDQLRDRATPDKPEIIAKLYEVLGADDMPELPPGEDGDGEIVDDEEDTDA
jgi:hypothetical protein